MDCKKNYRRSCLNIRRPVLFSADFFVVLNILVFLPLFPNRDLLLLEETNFSKILFNFFSFFNLHVDFGSSLFLASIIREKKSCISSRVGPSTVKVFFSGKMLCKSDGKLSWEGTFEVASMKRWDILLVSSFSNDDIKTIFVASSITFHHEQMLGRYKIPGMLALASLILCIKDPDSQGVISERSITVTGK